MKSIFNLLLSACLLFSFTACNDDDDVTPAKLPGTWAMTDFEADGTFSYELLGQPLTSNYTSEGSTYSSTLVFEENPNTFESSGSYTFILNTSIAGSPFVDTFTAPNLNLTGTWWIDNDKLYQVTSGDTFDFDINELTNTKLVLRQERTTSYTLDGVFVEDDGVVTTTFQRQ